MLEPGTCTHESRITLSNDGMMTVEKSDSETRWNDGRELDNLRLSKRNSSNYLHIEPSMS